MAVASFDELCAGFCDIVKVTPPLLKADAQDRVAFHVVLRETIVNLVHCPTRNPGHVFVVFEFGPLGQGGRDPLEEAQALLQANFNLLEVDSPVFSVNPDTGDAVLQFVYPLFEATPHDLYELIDKGVDRVAQWCNPPNPPAHAPEGNAPHPAGGPLAAIPNFA